jgi:hypothetical protein
MKTPNTTKIVRFIEVFYSCGCQEYKRYEANSEYELSKMVEKDENSECCDCIKTRPAPGTANLSDDEVARLTAEDDKMWDGLFSC